MKVILIKEKDHIRLMEGEGRVDEFSLAMRGKLSGGEIDYYELDFDESLGMRVDTYVAALNKRPALIGKSKMIRKIS